MWGDSCIEYRLLRVDCTCEIGLGRSLFFCCHKIGRYWPKHSNGDEIDYNREAGQEFLEIQVIYLLCPLSLRDRLHSAK